MDFIDTPRMAIINNKEMVMMEFLVEAVIISFTLGGLVGGLLSLKLVSHKKPRLSLPKDVLESGLPE